MHTDVLTLGIKSTWQHFRSSGFGLMKLLFCDGSNEKTSSDCGAKEIQSRVNLPVVDQNSVFDEV